MAKQFQRSGGGPPKLNQNNFGDIAKIQEFNNQQPYATGFVFGITATTKSFDVALGGSCRQLHGLIIIIPTASIAENCIITLNINQENVIVESNIRAWNPEVNLYKPDQFYPLRRALSGSDKVTLTVVGTASFNIYPIFYLSNA